VAFVEALPVEASGKVSRRSLRERLAGALEPL
jgi:acyl-coenzyme A synthetase/AMP-(fatty) acid ligase